MKLSTDYTERTITKWRETTPTGFRVRSRDFVDSPFNHVISSIAFCLLISWIVVCQIS